MQVEVGDPALVVAEARAEEILGETALFRPAWRREATLRTQTACGSSCWAAPPSPRCSRRAARPRGHRAPRPGHRPPPPAGRPQRAPRGAGGAPRRRAAQPPRPASRPGCGARAPAPTPSSRPTSRPLAPAFPDLPPPCAALAQDFTAEPFFAEQPIASTEEHAPPLRILAAGQVELRDPRGPAFEQRVVGRLGPGDLIDPVRAVHGHMGQTMAVAQTWAGRRPSPGRPAAAPPRRDAPGAGPAPHPLRCTLRGPCRAEHGLARALDPPRRVREPPRDRPQAPPRG